MRMIVILFALLFPRLVAADTPMTAEEFEAYVTGRTLSYGVNGEVYGAEEYHPGRFVTWSFLDGQCEEGRWYPQDDAICFVYDFDPDPHCWRFFRETGGLRAEFLDGTTLGSLYEVGEAEDGLGCIGPDIGV
ncbi:hypothetical protein JQU17_12570 [Ponticoccus sp. SC2-23]|uniref:hypothetical protein n=1 Tax=Alexandriicola marinus TaxID=2081710 RepID=UPI000FDA2BE0|nr:hypothetical protein [Alexandriicola marinus]MBM1221061.1 hypothetical protein [Ponticoccus sp. SC6-9]MBM1225631.1 hypothetical protein [Ponticoccus sp. SC6-15]MBM1227783.1 hypothetical protein [Ponticoccus sp. SC6-38]MBM1234579.1 hypothetical protein [Ponticoccus sp. SC6-45]MBM1238285.1 hypothetical protein [Ponticoccus sp. SC6-49]MBM1243554.1 hypothetical protein [Ponticoccus sp. SC2-64]MBM1248103.1 hypothetical protein [Ponticoccus sp. SC6-42]MBM1252685.1 hypothetical protein [Pontico